MLFHHFEEAQDVADSGERHTFFSRQVLDHLHFADVALRVAAAVGARAVRFDQRSVFVEHQRARVRLQDLRRDADGVQRLVDIAERRLCAAWRSRVQAANGLTRRSG